MVKAGLSFGPDWAILRRRSLIFDGDRQIASILAFRISSHGNASAESKAKVTSRIESGQRRQVTRDIVDGEPSAAHRVEIDPAWKLNPDCATWSAMHERRPDHRARADLCERTDRRTRPVRPKHGGAVTVAGKDQTVEVEARLDVELDRVALRRLGKRSGRRIAQTALRARRRKAGNGRGSRCKHDCEGSDASHIRDRRGRRLKQG